MNQQPPSDQDTLGRAVAGGVDSACELLKQHGPLLRRKLAGRIPQRWQSVLSEADVLQQTYADALTNIGRFIDRGAGSLDAWLWSIAQCNLRDALKMLGAEKRGGNRRRVQVDAASDSHDDLLERLAGTTTTPSRHAARAEARSILEAFLQELPPDYRRVVRMYDLEGKSIEQVCEALGRSPGAVFMLRARAHDRLRNLLGDEAWFFTDVA